MDVRLPDGTILRGVPDGTTKAEIVAKLQANGKPVPAEWLGDAPAAQENPAVVQLGEGLRDIPRQAGLVARTGVRAATALPGMVADAATGVVNAGLDAAAGKGKGFRFQTTRSAVDDLMNRSGLPQPQGATERVVTDAGEMLLGTGLIAKGSNAIAKATTGATQKVAQVLAANPVTQGAGAVGAGVAGGAVREAGGGPVEQFVASLVGGVGAGMGTQGSLRTYDKAAAKFTPRQMVEQRADKEITLILERSGIDWSKVPDNVKTGLREEVAAALNTGQPLNADAVRRLRVFKATGTTPTVGMLTQRPAQITAEKNLAKTGANSTDAALQRLPEVENQNVARLLSQLDDAGAANAPDAMLAGRTAVANLRGNVEAARATNAALYQQARDSTGRSVELDGAAVAQNAVRRLQSDNVGKLPAEVDGILNRLTTGEDRLTVDYQQQLVKNLYRKMRGTQDGDLRHGLGIIRDALDNADPLPARQVNPSNLPAVPGTVPQSPMTAGAEAIEAYKRARTAHRELMRRIESNPALAAVVDGVEPDQFVKRFILSNSEDAAAANVSRVVEELTPSVRDQMRQYLARHLKDAATNSTDDITKFSNAAYRKALRDIGDEKLRLFFDKDQLQQLKDIGDAAKYMQSQPAGSAVNNSNSGALVLGRGYDLLDRIANKVPLGGRDIMKGWVQGRQQTQVLAPRNALTLAADRQGLPMLPVNPLVALTAPVQAREDNKRN